MPSVSSSSSCRRSHLTSRQYQITHHDDAFNLRLDVPGFHLDDLQVEVEDQTLTIKLNSPPPRTNQDSKSEHDESLQDPNNDQETWIFNELTSNSTSYRFTLPPNVESDQIHAELKNGQLFLTLPKSQSFVKQINIQKGA